MAIVLTTREAPTAEALDDEVYLTLPVVTPTGAEPADVSVFLTLEFARRMIVELQQAVANAAKSALIGAPRP
jgi:hypothetical protein